MRRRIAFVLGMLMAILMLSACGTDPAYADYNGYSYEDLKLESSDNVSMIAQLASIFEQSAITEADITRDMREALSVNYGITEYQIDAALRWMELTEELGPVLKADESSFVISKAGNTLTTDITLVFEERNVTFQVVYTYYSMEISGITIEPIYTMSEKLGKAGMNTIISISVVFSVLILISLIIACFRVFPYLEKREADKRAAAAPAVPVQPAMHQQEPVHALQPADDEELVAAIAAAIAAASGASADDFVVRSINRR